ncbi:MAG TPA: hypothetical protein VJ305_08800 [Streptosporangiaceae bacterium]|nr:hypothetical protein [Streptosporangiaceae bacterium]
MNEEPAGPQPGHANDELDITSTEALAKLIEELARRDVRVALAHVHATAADMIRRYASDGNPGPERIFPNLDSAVTWASTSPVSSVPRAEEELWGRPSEDRCRWRSGSRSARSRSSR